mmetsp:Transcript_22504/g.26681  ORF Transcript_22504/g.26681 Transcript_22504/m.26681 type:complete len:139 (-) Transcript_22504:243-659(-)
MTSSSATKTTGTQPLMNDASVGLLENYTMTEQQIESTELGPEIISTSTLSFGPESYLTPRRSARDYVLSLDPPSPPSRKNIEKVFERTDHLLLYINIPFPDLNANNHTIPLVSNKKSLYKLQPRTVRVYNLPRDTTDL